MINDTTHGLRQFLKHPGFTIVGVLALPTFVFLARVSFASEILKPLAVVPFHRDDTLMLVEVRINDSAPFLFAVDTGASHTVLDPKFAKELGLQVQEAPPTTGTGQGAVIKSHGPPLTMHLGAVAVEVPEPWVIDLSKAPLPAGVKGLIGAELFKNFIVRIDQLQATLTIFAPDAEPGSAGAASIPLFVEGDKLFLEATLEVPAGKTVTHRLRIDTGSGSSVNDEIVRTSAEVRESTLGGGLGDNFKSYSGVFTSVKIGPYLIEHVWGPGGPGPSIGMELLRRFVITFDAPHGRLYLEPTPALSEPVPTPPPN
ncbi:MAG: retropepsin-like aspartic protease [Chthoniobacterales bacterium]